MNWTQGSTQRITLLSALYFAQGLPYGFFTQALPALLRKAGYSLTMISALSLLYLPWALKFLWAPYIDHVGTRRTWLLVLQISSVAGALLLSVADPGHHLTLVLVAAFVFNIIAATQDIVTDGLAVRMLEPSELGTANGIQVGAYRIGMILGGGVLLMLFDRTGWSTVFACMGALLALTVLPVFSLREPPISAATRGQQRLLFTGWVKRLIKPGTLMFVFLICCYRFGDSMVSSILNPFLSDQGLTLAEIGAMKGIVGSGTSLLGAVLGGWFVTRVGRRHALLFSGLAQALTYVSYIVAALHVGGVAMLWFATVTEGVIGTMATVALFTLMMDASDPDHAGTDYTLFASTVVVVFTPANFVAAAIGDAFGYFPAFITGTVLAAAGTLALVRILDAKPTSARVAAVWSSR